MSNSRNIKRSIKRNLTAVAAIGTATMGAGALILPGVASATVAGGTETITPTNATPASVYPGLSNQAVPGVQLTVPNTFTNGDTISLPIQINNSTTGTPSWVANGQATATQGTSATTPAYAVTYSALPTITVAAASANAGTTDTAPTVSAKLVTNPADSNADLNAGITDEVVLTFTNNNTGVATDKFTITVGGTMYNVGASAGSASGPIGVAIAALGQDAGTTTSTAFTGSPVHNADIQNYVLTETPAGVPTSAVNAPVSDFALTETVPGTLAVGKYTLSAANGVSFTGTATVTAKGVTVAAVPTSGTCPTTGGTSSASVSASGGTIVFCVVSATTTTTGPGSLTISGLTVSAPTTNPNPPLTAGPAPVTLAGPNQSYSTTQPAVTVVYNPTVAGYTADDTAAAAALARGSGGAVILASDAEYQDALSASFLGNAPLPYSYTRFGRNYTGTSTTNPVLLNPSDVPAGGEATTAAANAIRKLGATTVYVVGGTAAISDNVVNQLRQQQYSYSGYTGTLQVIRIAGTTAEATAAQVAQYPSIGSLDQLTPTPGAYGLYNSGASESATGPTSQVPTAILADSGEFQDALAASPLAYSQTLPVLLNPAGQGLDPNASAAITNLGIKQVIVVGGSSAVSDTAVANLIGMGVSVLRIAGTTFDATAANLGRFELNNYTPKPATGSAMVDGLNSAATEDANGGSNAPSVTVGTSRGDAYQDALASAQLLGAQRGNIDPLLLNASPTVIPAATGNFLTSYGTAPNGGLTKYGSSGTASSKSIKGDIVFGGTLAQTPALVQAELNDIAAG